MIKSCEFIHKEFEKDEESGKQNIEARTDESINYEYGQLKWSDLEEDSK